VEDKRPAEVQRERPSLPKHKPHLLGLFCCWQPNRTPHYKKGNPFAFGFISTLNDTGQSGHHKKGNMLWFIGKNLNGRNPAKDEVWTKKAKVLLMLVFNY